MNDYLIAGTAHCSDFYPPSMEDHEDLIKGRQLVTKSIGSFLS